jgi:hypothetical protein
MTMDLDSNPRDGFTRGFARIVRASRRWPGVAMPPVCGAVATRVDRQVIV